MQSDLSLQTQSTPTINSSLAEKLVTNSQFSMIVIDAQGIIREWNPAAERLLGYARDQAFGRKIFELLVSKEDPENLKERLLKRLAPSEHGQSEQAIRIATHANGKSIEIEYSSVPFVFEGENLLLLWLRDLNETSHLKKRLNQTQQHLSAVFNNTFQFTGLLSPDGTFLEINRSALKFLGITRETVIGMPFWKGPWWNGNPTSEQWAYKAVQIDTADEFRRNELEVHGFYDSSRIMDCMVSAVYNEDRQLTLWVVEGHDITERKQAQHALHKSEVHQRMVLESLAEGVVVQDSDGRVLSANPSAEQLLGVSLEEMRGKRIDELPWRAIQADGMPFSVDALPWVRAWRTGQTQTTVIMGVQRPNAALVWISGSTRLLTNDGESQPYAVVSSFFDITDRKELEEKLEILAHHDTLTTLPNRLLFRKKLELALESAEHHGRLVAVAFIDLDRFKGINDTLGHGVGDALLLKVANRLLASVRNGDTVARMGGDEFTLILDDIGSLDDVNKVASKVLQALAPTFQIQGHELNITGSIGVAVYPGDGTNVETLLKHADTAMYRAKDSGKNTFRLFAPRMGDFASDRLHFEAQLRRALERHEFQVHYQPQYHLNNQHQTITGIEALLRWHHPQQGMIPPHRFIPVLEDTDLIAPIGAWVLREACLNAVRISKRTKRPFSVAVNVSAAQFPRSDFTQLVAEALETSGLNPQQLELELTESLVMQDVDAAAARMQKLRDLGVKLAIDDFGTGYSSLSHLRRLPFDILKIDRSFIAELEQDGALVKSIIELGRNLGLEVVAEGIETENQAALLRELNCERAQGFLWSPAVPFPELVKLIDFDQTMAHSVSRD
jgi:diguanylate cyclase (GGDEF)-like protein/PAS domain S-box-containing protein